MSSAPEKCDLLITEPAAGTWNMAVDEVLLEHVAETGTPTLRFYAWESPTLSLGYFQNYADRSQHPDSLDAQIVRRLSGGGAIMHDHELTYSLMIPASHSLAHDTQALYDIVHQTIAAELNRLLSECGSLARTMLCDRPSKLRKQDEPFLCFQRRTLGDIVLIEQGAVQDAPNDKVVGSAQRRRRGSVLQHGSILLRRSDLAPTLRGVFDDVSHYTTFEEKLLKCLIDSLPRALQLQPEESHLDEALLTQAQALQDTKFASDLWTKRR